MKNFRILLLTAFILLVAMNAVGREGNTFLTSQKKQFHNTSFPNILRSIKNFFYRVAGKRRIIREPPPPVINNVYLSRETIIKNCQSHQGNLKLGSDQSIIVATDAIDFDGDVLLYSYEVSGGYITGEGSTVVWNLSNVSIGKYSIKIFIDDGCGACNKPAEREIKVVEQPNCLVSN